MSEWDVEDKNLECDLVMRGGVTSGLVYPKAVAEISKTYRFRSIGGTSAGAIAAAVTAAAEYGRRKIIAAGRPDLADTPFQSVGKMPEELQERKRGRTKLLRLFQPQKMTDPLFRIFLAAADSGAQGHDPSKPGGKFEDRALCIAKGIVRAFPVSSLLGALPGYLLGVSIVAGLSRPYWVKESVTAALEGGGSSFTVFGLSPFHAFAWLGSSFLVMALLLGICLIGLWASRTGFRALSALIFALPAGLVFFIQYLYWLGLSLSGADDFSVFSIHFGLLIASFASIVGAVLTSLIMTGRRASRALPENMYGICSGMTADPKMGAPGVTEWLHQMVQRLAGRTGDEAPLTAGDLWHPNGCARGYPDPAEAPRDVELSLMVTNVTRGISHRFPFMEGWRGSLYFRARDFVQLFPRSVVVHMVRHAQGAEREVLLEEGMFRLPAAKDLPVVFGARMSMAYPFLLSAVPLYAVDWSVQHADGKFRLRRCWFSDGGLTSNFPISLFDRPLPSRPTFGINLVPDTARFKEVALEETGVEGVLQVDVDATDFDGRVAGAPKAKSLFQESVQSPQAQSEAELWDDVWMPRRNDQDLFKVMRFNDFEGSRGSIGGFFEALFDTARNWADTELMHMPGYRDRIVHVELKPHEGGLNLNMPDKVIRDVGEKGRLAGKLLAARFDPNPGRDPHFDEPIELGWENHRWVRYRATMAALEHVARDLVVRLKSDSKHGDVKSYRALLDDSMQSTSLYRWASREQYLFALQATGDLTRFVSQWMREYETFDRVYNPRDYRDDGLSPRPKATFTVAPPRDADPMQERLRNFSPYQD